MAEKRLRNIESKRAAYLERVQAILTLSQKLDDEKSVETFLAHMETLDSIRDNYLETVEKINELQMSIAPDAEPSFSTWLEFEDVYCRIKRQHSKLTAPREVKPDLSLTKTAFDVRPVGPKLPPIELPEFNGDARSWPLFYASFKTTVHENSSLSENEKLFYLIGKLTGKAQSVCAGLTPCAENYTIIFNSLVSKYDDKRLQSTAYLDQFINLKPVSTVTPESLDNFVDKLSSSVAALKGLKLTDLCDFILLHIASKKLDADMIRAFEMDSRDTEIPTFDNLITFLRGQVKILQRTSSTKPSHVYKKSTEHVDFPKGGRHMHTYLNLANESPRSTSRSLAPSPRPPANNNISTDACSLCDAPAPHEQLYRCAGFQRLTPHERYNHVKTFNYCLNCLSYKHRINNCNSNSTCRKCNNKHHSMLHFDNSSISVPALTGETSYGQVSLPNHSIEYPMPAGFVPALSQPPAYASSNSRSNILSPGYPIPAAAECNIMMTSGQPAPPPPAVNRAPAQAYVPVSANLAPRQTPDEPGSASAHMQFSINNCSNVTPSDLPTTVLLATARVIVHDSNGQGHLVRCLLDSASQSNFITRDCCDRLGLNTYQKNTTVRGIARSSKVINSLVNVKFFSRHDRNINYEMDSLVVDKVTDRLPNVQVDRSMLTYFDSLQLADDTYAITGDIDMLIGASLFPHLLLGNRVQGHYGSPCALETVLGYVIIGNAPASVNNSTLISCCCVVPPSVDNMVQRFWELEEINVPHIQSPDDHACEEIYKDTTTRDSDGRYMVTLPFKDSPSLLGDSYECAKKRFLCLERKMKAKPEFKRAYDGVIREYLAKDYIAPALPDTDETTALPSYVIPHHGVLREEKSTTKLRVVLDASAKTSTSISLNSILHGGENLQGNLFEIILNFRLFKIALCADIRQMFFCIGVQEQDRRFQRILYRFDPADPLTIFEFKRVCFGLKSSPFHALRTINQLIEDEGHQFPRAKVALENALYMDDYVYSVGSEVEGIETAREVIALLKRGQFDLVKWNSNSVNVLSTIPQSHRLSAVVEFDKDENQKVLGLSWSPVADNFFLDVSQPMEKCTKRTILSCIARLWDLMGFIGPVILFAKLLIKELWLAKCDWDDKPPDAILKLWDTFRNELHLLNKLEIPRHVSVVDDSVITVVGFGDASERGYGAVVYVHVNNNGIIETHILCSKSRVSPTKTVSLARLELCAALILAKLIRIVLDTWGNRIDIDRVYAFSDSTVALCWIHSSPHRWSTFVANRVSKIQSALSADCFYHVTGVENPADCLSRGLTPSQILNHPLWFRGPSWMLRNPTDWPIVPFDPSVVSQPPEEKTHALISTEVVELPFLLALAERMSSWSKLLRCVVYICRFGKMLPRRQYVLASDLDFAEAMIIRALQQHHFAKEFTSLEASRRCSRAFQRLKPFIQNGIIRVGGRLEASELSYQQKHPVILPRKAHVVNLIVDYFHKLYCHAGSDELLSALRQYYWIFAARNIVRSRIYLCLPCFRLRPKSDCPEMSDHKACRIVKAAKAFVHTGVDFAGPLRVTVTRGRGIRSQKAYICIFVCMTTRAVHIEMASDLSTSCFLSALTRFLSRRGPVFRLYSDNGTNFVGAKRYLDELHAFLASKHFKTEFAHVLAENRIHWHMNPPAAPHFGGNWEANVKSLKAHLFRVIGDHVLSIEEMNTVLTQVEAVMNSRPLCRTLSADPAEPLALTPAHFLTLTPLKYFPAREVEEERLHLLSRHSLLDKLVQTFWKRWHREYLATLQTRMKWNTPTAPIAVGTVVVIRTDNLPSLHWPLGIVDEIFPGKDGVVRVAKVRISSGSYLRPVVRLCPLPNQ